MLCRLLDAKNGNWVAPNLNREIPEIPIPTVTAVKDMIVVKTTKHPTADYEVIVTNSTIPGMLSNGKEITQENISAMLDELKIIFPDGTSWGDNYNGDDYYYQSKAFGGGGGCNAWTYMCYDILFGTNATRTRNTDLYDVKPGDAIVWVNKAGITIHWIFVTSVAIEQTSKLVNGKVIYFDDTIITYCDGNNNDEVNWNGTTSISAMLGGYPNSVLYSAY